MKGGLCCALFAAQALRDAGVRLAGRLVVERVIGEEDGGVGTLAAVLRSYTADGVIVVEPAGMSASLAIICDSPAAPQSGRRPQQTA